MCTDNINDKWQDCNWYKQIGNCKFRATISLGLHNHPTNIPPTGSDFMAAGYRGYRFGLIICHNGDLYKYKIEKPFQKHVFDKNVEEYISPPYNLDVEKAFDKVIGELERFGVKCEKL
ncbi:hypothetical protein ABHA96_00330 [Ligilactobacillus ruminis]|uniref:hypothetical protein n=2 Tax=Ligilactobacillus ruminis TaxID=1623 RepID=UPI00325BA77A